VIHSFSIMKPPTNIVIPWIIGFSLGLASLIEASEKTESEVVEERADAESQFQLGRSYLRGDGVPKDEKKAFELMKSAAAQGHADAIGGVGYFYSNGVVVDKDDKQAVEWFRKGAEKGSAKAQLNLGKCLLDGKTGDAGGTSPQPFREQGLQWIKKAADQGLPEASFTYGRIFYFGDYDQPKDYGNAMIYLKSAADKGIADAQNMVGTMYEFGMETPADAAAAEHWYRKAALQGHSKAQSNLGSLLGPLSENRKTRIEALAWLVLAWKQGEVTAEKHLEDVGPGLKAGEFDEAKQRAIELNKLVKK
jgi:TPR repeat protein